MNESGSIKRKPSFPDRFEFFGKRRCSSREEHLFEKMVEGMAEGMKEFDVIVTYYRNMPSMTTTQTVHISASDAIEAEEIVRDEHKAPAFPNIQDLEVRENDEKTS